MARFSQISILFLVVGCGNGGNPSAPGDSTVLDSPALDSAMTEDARILSDSDLASSEPTLVITEIMPNPSAVGDSQGEWLELFNPSSVEVNLKGWVIADEGDDYHTITQSVAVSPGQYVVLARNTDSATNGGVTVAYQYASFDLVNTTADQVILLNSSGKEVDRVHYGPSWPLSAGASMELQSPGLDNALSSSWCMAAAPFGAGDLGSPGAASSCAPADAGPPFDAGPPSDTLPHGDQQTGLAPDLFLKSLSVSDKAGTVTYEVQLCNLGGDLTSLFQVGIIYDGKTTPDCNTSVSDQQTVNGLLGLQCVTQTFARTGAPDGIYKAWARVDPGCALHELDESNNNKSKDYIVGSKDPDLVIKTVTVNTSNTVTYSITVCNEGYTSISGDISVGLFFDATSAPTCASSPNVNHGFVTILAPGGCYTDTIYRAFSPKPGKHTDWIMADPSCKWTESNENNNTKSVTYTKY